MFTGIVEKTVTIVTIVAASDSGSARRLVLSCPWPDVQQGQSIAVNGCCLTVAGQSSGRMEFDAVAETLAKTNLGLLKAGDEVHLERSLRLGERLDGHIVQGHIDGTGALLSRREDGGECRLAVGNPPELMAYIIPKGSITLDGVSLTVAVVNADNFEVALIPTTLELTAMARRPIGWRFNIETDILSRTIVFWLERRAKSGQSLA